MAGVGGQQVGIEAVSALLTGDARLELWRQLGYTVGLQHLFRQIESSR